MVGLKYDGKKFVLGGGEDGSENKICRFCCLFLDYEVEMEALNEKNMEKSEVGVCKW